LLDDPPVGAYGLLVIDVDQFKTVNDTHGHPAGDELLVGIVQALRDSVRTSDTVYRIGGDEFVIVLPQAETDRALEIAERCRESVASRYATDFVVPVTVSIGVTASDRSRPLGIHDAIEAADSALYQAKRAGRNQTAYSASHQHV
ncbi:MAG: GGDEF domain-containing protein, partial [Candidatus Nanopelagicales bacterium]